MADVRRRDLLLGAGAVAAVGGGAAVAVAASGDPSKPLTIDVSKGTPTLPQYMRALPVPADVREAHRGYPGAITSATSGRAR